jgi:twitching motility protein PilU
VVRTIVNEIPDLAQLGLPQILEEIVMTKRGPVLVVGATGSGKSTSLAAMINPRRHSDRRDRRYGNAISYDEAIRNADSANELRLNIKLNSKRGTPAAALQVAAG